MGMHLVHAHFMHKRGSTLPNYSYKENAHFGLISLCHH